MGIQISESGRFWGALELQLQVAVNHLTWVLGNKLVSSAEAEAVITAESSL